MISGHDTLIEAPSRQDAWEAVLSAVGRSWPEFVCESLNDERPVAGAKLPASPPCDREFFFYPDAEAATDWEADGGTADNQDRLVHVLFGPDGSDQGRVRLTVVHAGPGTETGQIARRIETLVTARRVALSPKA